MSKFNKLNKYEIKRMELEVEELKESLRLFQQREEVYKMELKELLKEYRESERYKNDYRWERNRKSEEIEKLKKEVEELKEKLAEA